jgi:hypothetical protein
MIQPVSITLRKYSGLITSSPEEYGCGLAVDINHIPDMPTGNVIAPIECVVNSNPRNIPLFQNSTLQFKSRIINGNFTRGYCMRMLRGNVVSHHPYSSGDDVIRPEYFLKVIDTGCI